MKEVTIGLHNKIFEIAPGYRRGVLVVQGIKNEPSSPELQRLLEQAMQKVRQELTIEDPKLEAWREAFTKASIKPNKFRPSVDALVRRVLNGNPLPNISTVVDIGTILSLRHVLPCGAHSLNDVTTELTLRPASGFEQFIPFGSHEAEPIMSNEIVLADGNTVATSKWAWRQAEHTIIRPETTALELNIDALSVIDDQAFQETIDDAQDLFKTLLGKEAAAYVLNKDNPTIIVNVEE